MYWLKWSMVNTHPSQISAQGAANALNKRTPNRFCTNSPWMDHFKVVQRYQSYSGCC